MSKDASIPLARHDDGRQTASQRAADFEKAVRTCAGDAGEYQTAAMELAKIFLIDPRVVIGLTVDRDKAVTQFDLNDGLDDHVDEIPHILEVG
jgi:hypothetical protein